MKNLKDIRNNYIKESLLDYESIANSIKENSKDIVRDLLKEEVANEFRKILTEDEKEDAYEVEEVEDTNQDDVKEDETEVEDTAEEDKSDTDEDGAESAVEDTNSDDGGEIASVGEWDGFDKYKMDDGAYDFSQADDEDFVKVFKLLKNDDQVFVNADKDSKKVEIKDNAAGAEYIIDFSNNDADADSDSITDSETDLSDNLNMQESKVYEILRTPNKKNLKEYNSHVGYTDNYQDKDVMTNDGVKEPGKNVNDWDAGVPKGTEKPWVGKQANAPFDKPVKQKLSEEDEVVEENEDEMVDEATNVGGFVQQNSTSKSHIPNSNGRKARNSSIAGVKTKGTSDPRYKEAMAEAKKLAEKVNKIENENKQLKEALKSFKSILSEAAVTNVNLGRIIKLFNENSTTRDEKQEIIKRFGEVKTLDASNSLYESIKRELKSNKTMNIEEGKQFTTNGSQQINETKIYESEELHKSLDLMHRLCR